MEYSISDVTLARSHSRSVVRVTTTLLHNVTLSGDAPS